MPLPSTKALESCNPRAPSIEDNDAGLTAIDVTEATKDPKKPALHHNERCYEFTLLTRDRKVQKTCRTEECRRCLHHKNRQDGSNDILFLLSFRNLILS